MSKNLGNIPPQVTMTEEQQQTYTNGFNRGRKAERKAMLKFIETLETAECGFGITHDLVETIKTKFPIK